MLFPAGGAGGRKPQRSKLGFGFCCQVATGIAADELAKLVCTGGSAVEFQQRLAFHVKRIGSFIVGRVFFKYQVKGLERFFEIVLGEVNIADPELRRGRKRTFPVVFQIIIELLQREIDDYLKYYGESSLAPAAQ